MLHIIQYMWSHVNSFTRIYKTVTVIAEQVILSPCNWFDLLILDVYTNIVK